MLLLLLLVFRFVELVSKNPKNDSNKNEEEEEEKNRKEEFLNVKFEWDVRSYVFGWLYLNGACPLKMYKILCKLILAYAHKYTQQQCNSLTFLTILCMQLILAETRQIKS